MGDPGKSRKKYSKPFKLWQRDQLDADKAVTKEFGLKNKHELWRTGALVRKFTSQAKRLIALKSKQAEIERRQMMEKLNKLGLIKQNASLDEVLGLEVKNFMARRLQTIVFKKNLARSIAQARQFITHRHISVNDKIITAPSYIVPTELEEQVAFVPSSALSKPEHPERLIKEAAKEVSDATK
ncbi:30S ribosomal protein S4 [Candidatus Woesearchaeota archaeon]|nr:30S ribosomal protein S4 [Candidatus Woesearchaeota archaeon]